MGDGAPDVSPSASHGSVHVVADHESMSKLAASLITESVRRLTAEHPAGALRVVLSAGNTPLRAYELLATDPKCEFDWSTVHLYQMDEYVDLVGAAPDFCRLLLDRVVGPLGIQKTSLLDRQTIAAGCSDWQRAITGHERTLVGDGGIDLVVHGIGSNGHLGFNEPGSDPLSAGRLVEFTECTRRSLPPGPRPTCGVTLGLGVLLAARESILLASGSEKAAAVARVLHGPVANDCPASWLRLARHTNVVVDRAAAGWPET